MTRVSLSLGRLRQLRDALRPAAAARATQLQRATDDQQAKLQMQAEIGNLAQSLGLHRLASEEEIAAAIQAAGPGAMPAPRPVARPVAPVQPAIVAQRPARPARTIEQQIADVQQQIAQTERLLAETPAGKQKKVNDMLRMTPAGRKTLAKKGLT